MSNTKIDLLGMPINESERLSSISSLKSLAKSLKDKEKAESSVAALKRGIAEAESEKSTLRPAKSKNSNAEKEARAYAESVLAETPDSRVLVKNRTICLLWLAAFGLLLLAMVIPKGVPLMQTDYRNMPHTSYLILSYAVAAIATLYKLLATKKIEKGESGKKYLINAAIPSGIVAAPMLLFTVTVTVNAHKFTASVGDILINTLPPALVSIAAIMISGALDIPLSKQKNTKMQTLAYEAAYRSEYSRITSETKEAAAHREKKLSEINERVASLKAKLVSAESELKKATEQVDRLDVVPEFYKDREIVSELILSIEASFAGSIFNSVRLYEQQRAQKMLVKYQEAVASEARAKEESEYMQGYMTVQMHDAGGREKTIADIQRRIKQNNDMANDIYRACGSDKRV